MSKKADSERKQATSNRRYKKRIYNLCEDVLNRKNGALEKLEKELSRRTLASWAVKHWLKANSSRLNKNVLDSDFLGTGIHMPKHGNAFKPYQGGAFELGKK